MLTFLTGPVAAVRTDARAAFASELSDQLDEDVTIKPTLTYGALYEDVVRGRGDFAWLPPAVYVRADDSSAVDLLLCGVRHQRAHFRGTLFVREDTRFESLDDLRGTRVAWVDQNSCAGFLFVRLALREAGIDPDDHFEEQRFLGDHVAVVHAVESGDADVGATFMHVTGDPSELQVEGTGWDLQMSRERMRSLLISEAIPADTIVAISGDRERRDRFAAAMQGLQDSESGRNTLGGPFGVERFEPALPTHYDVVRKALG